MTHHAQISTRSRRHMLAVTLCAAAVLAAVLPERFVAPAVAETKPTADAAKTIDYERDIQPIFEQHCYSCHGPKKQESSFRLDDSEAALKGGDLGAAYVPGKGVDSALLKYVAGTDPDLVMPPDDSNVPKLTTAEVDLVRAWIDQGAVRPKARATTRVKGRPEDHWAFRRPTMSELPAVQAAGWVRNPIDSFILARLENAGLAPEHEADRATLIRRLSLDLTGMPPTVEEVRQYVNDTSPNAYERLVDRLLESPRYGERWALWWLDLARYADTNGYEVDRPRSIWLYRDWVINAFNQNMPFDEFTIEQLAGDLLPNPTVEQRIATGFHRNTFINEEGGHNWEQFRWESIVDRVSTTGTVFLGLTMGCAQCHDHKFDPVSQKEYYQFFAFLNDDDEPLLEVQKAEITHLRERAQADIARREAKLVARLEPQVGGGSNLPEDSATRFEHWREQAASEVRNWNLLKPVRWTTENNAELSELDDQSLLAHGDNPEVTCYNVTYRLPAGRVTGIRLEALPHESLPLHGPGRGYFKDDGTFLLSEISATAHEGGAEAEKSAKPIKLTHPTATINQKIVDQALDGDKLTGWHIRGSAGVRQVLAVEFATPFVIEHNGELTVKLVQNMGHEQAIGRFRMWATTDDGAFTASTMPIDVERTLLKPTDHWTADEERAVKRYYVSIAPEFRKEYKEIDTLQRNLPAQPTTLVLKHRPTPRVSHLHTRGDFARPAVEVTPDVPRFLPPLPEDGPRDRLMLARWLVSGENPLTARVVVNQLWQCYFGRGLVNTPEDFGFQGAAPSHPELLDWLACQFVEKKWDLKQMHRLIVTSATYRQSSVTTSKKLGADPENVLLSRGPRFRLPAETIRDIALTTSGLLNPEIGGPSIYTPQPAGTLAGAFGDPKWPTADGAERFRRGMYTHRKRTAPYAAFAAFDGPPHNTCVMRRIRSNTPLQALAQLNDEMQIAASQALARRILHEQKGDDNARLGYAFELCLSRPPRDEENRLLLAYFQEQQRRFQGDVTAAATVAGIENAKSESKDDAADLAAWTLVGRALLNLDEAISKE